jgi:hypothetical protein
MDMIDINCRPAQESRGRQTQTICIVRVCLGEPDGSEEHKIGSGPGGGRVVFILND